MIVVYPVDSWIRVLSATFLIVKNLIKAEFARITQITRNTLVPLMNEKSKCP